MILDTIVESTILRVAESKKKKSPETVKAEALELVRAEEGYAFFDALAKPGMSFICEVKKASPSKGLIAEEFDYLAIAKEYEAIGASAISVLTEPEFFKGSNRYLQEIKAEVKIPVLRKDFVIDEYQIYEAKTLGADAILLICAILSKEQLKEYLALAESLGLSALVETHNETEVLMALEAGAKIVGVNNRDLTTFHVDTDTTVRLSKLIPSDALFVSESGIWTAEDMQKIKATGASAVLIGEAFMRAENREELIRGLKS